LAGFAAAYAVGIYRNYPLVDGNKRAALVFLEINGYRLVIGDTKATIDTIRTVEAVASGELEENDLTRWIADRSERMPEENPRR
jgi:death-on-curing protein